MPKILTKINLTLGKDMFRPGQEVTVSDEEFDELTTGKSAKYIEVIEPPKKKAKKTAGDKEEIKTGVE